jgi:hypothetical protein
MTRFGSISQLLDDLSPRELTDEPVWDDVLARAALLSGSCGDANGRVTQWGGLSSSRGGRRSARGMRRRPLLVALIVLVCVLVPVSALAVAKNDPWWFLRFQPLGLGPAKGSHVVVIKQGSWNGHSWVLTAYRSGAGQLCFELTENAPNGRHSGQGGGGCAPVPGSSVATPNVRRTLRVTYLAGSFVAANGHGSVRYIVGPVVSKATEVVITLADGTVMRTPTFSAPTALGLSMRFYAVSAPTASTSTGSHTSCGQRVASFASTRPAKLIGLDANGHTVAKLTVPGQPPGFAQAFCAPHRNHFVLPPNLPAAGRNLKTVGRVTGPYGARATIAVGNVVPIASGRILPSGRVKHFAQLSRCWKVSFSNGQSQGTCTPQTKRYEPELSPQVQHAGRDTFVIAQTPPRTGSQIVRVVLRLANGQALTAKPIDGIVVFAIPRTALSTTKSQRGYLTGYDNNGRHVSFYNSFGHGVRFDRQPVYYRSCPPGSSCYG